MKKCYVFLQKNILLSMTLIISTVYCFFFFHLDLSLMMVWSTSFLDCFTSGHLAQYQSILYLFANAPSNYSVLIQVINALWISPLYLFAKLTQTPLLLTTYCEYYKIFVYLIALCSIYLMHKIYHTLQLPIIYEQIVLSLTLLSPFWFLEIFAKGQVDFLANFLFLIAIYYFLQQKYLPASFWIGCSIVIKPFALLFFIPAILLLLFQEKLNIIKYLIAVAVCPAIEFVISHTFFEHYAYYQKVAEKLVSKNMNFYFYDNIFYISVANISIFILFVFFICFACFYLSEHQLVSKKHFVFFPALLFLSMFLFLNIHGQWFIYLLFPLLMLAVSCMNLLDLCALQFVFSSSFILHYLAVNSNLSAATIFRTTSFSSLITNIPNIIILSQTVSAAAAIILLLLLGICIKRQHITSSYPIPTNFFIGLNAALPIIYFTCCIIF